MSTDCDAVQSALIVPLVNPESPVFSASVGFEAVPVTNADEDVDDIEHRATTVVCPAMNNPPIDVNSGLHSGISPAVGPPGCIATMKSPGFDGIGAP
jgi:hypothetical protein